MNRSTQKSSRRSVSPNATVTFARVDHHVISLVNPDMRNKRLARVCREEEQVAPLQSSARQSPALDWSMARLGRSIPNS